MSQTKIDDLTDQLLSKVFRNLVDVTDFRKCRQVSKRWNRTVMSACRDKFHLRYPLTDSTLYTIHEVKDALVSFDIYAFTGKENKDLWSNSGIKLLMQTTEWLQFSGNEVSTSEFRKILDLAKDSLKTLSLRNLQNNFTLQLLGRHTTFSALRKLAIGYYGIDINYGTFKTFTCTLEKWISLDCRVQLPSLESLNLYFDDRVGGNMYYGSDHATTEALFLNYLAIAKLLLKYKQTLKEVQIERTFRFVQMFRPHEFRPQWTEMERGLEALDELALNRLKVSSVNHIDHPFGIEVLGRPSNLKNLLFQNLIYPYYDAWPLLIATLSSLNNVNSRYLKSLKINLDLHRNEDPTLVINLGVLRECINLRTLWLIVNSDSRKLFARNVEHLPRGISILRFQHQLTHPNHYCMGEEILLNQEQIRWIIDNLRGLESFWMGLVIPDQTNENNNNAAVQVAVQANNGNANGDDDLDDGQPQQQVDVNRLVNINLITLRDLRTLPNLKDLRLEMMKATALAAIIRDLQGQAVQHRGLGTTLTDIQEYQNVFDAAEYTTTRSTSPGFGVNNTEGFATLAIQKKQK